MEGSSSHASAEVGEHKAVLAKEGTQDESGQVTARLGVGAGVDLSQKKERPGAVD